MFDNLSKKLDKAFQLLKGQGQITEINVAETLKEVRRALLEADVNFKTAKDFTNKIKDKAIGQKVLTSLKPGQLLIKIVKDELTQLMGSNTQEIDLSSNPSIILMSGLQGSGKTTFCAKLALHLKNKGKNPLLAACDVYRPAAIDQLSIIAEQVDVPIYSDPDLKDPVEIAKRALYQAKKNKNNVLIVDTAGRLAIDELLMKEIYNIHKAIKPNETLFVVDSMTGQDAVNTAKPFNDILDYQGVLLTKLEVDTRGGAALSVLSVTGKPIKFMAVGETIDALEAFHPERISSRILGMGDVMTLIEEAEQKIDKKKAKRLAQKMTRGKKFDLEDFRDQIQQMNSMGGIASMLDKIPGMGQIAQAGNEKVNDSMFVQMEAIINSMTPSERRYPDNINGSRKKRIAGGSGTQIQDVNRLLKQHKQMQKMMKKVGKKGGMTHMMRGIGGMSPAPGFPRR